MENITFVNLLSPLCCLFCLFVYFVVAFLVVVVKEENNLIQSLHSNHPKQI